MPRRRSTASRPRWWNWDRGGSSDQPHALSQHHENPRKIVHNISRARSSLAVMEQRLAATMTEQDREISAMIAAERPRLRNFIRKRVPNEADVEDLLQEVFYEVVEAYRLMEPVQRWSAWMFQVARNRIVDLFRKRRLETLAGAPVAVSDEGEPLLLEDVLPSLDAGPAEAYARSVLAEEVEGESFKQIAARTGIGENTLLSRKHYAVLHLRRRLKAIYDEFVRTEEGQIGRASCRERV